MVDCENEIRDMGSMFSHLIWFSGKNTKLKPILVVVKVGLRLPVMGQKTGEFTQSRAGFAEGRSGIPFHMQKNRVFLRVGFYFHTFSEAVGRSLAPILRDLGILRLSLIEFG